MAHSGACCICNMGKDTQGIKGNSDTYRRTIKEKDSLEKEHFFLWGIDLGMLLIPTQLLSHDLSSAGQAGNTSQKSLWVKIKTGTSLTNYDHGQNRLDLGKKLIKFIKILALAPGAPPPFFSHLGVVGLILALFWVVFFSLSLYS